MEKVPLVSFELNGSSRHKYYEGAVNANGKFKVGWKPPLIQCDMRHTETGIYVFIHNLNYLNYATSVALLNKQGCISVIDQSKNTLTIEILDNDGNRIDSDFRFSMSVVDG